MSQKIKSLIYFAVLVLACVVYTLSENTSDNQEGYTSTANETTQQNTVSYNNN